MLIGMQTMVRPEVKLYHTAYEKQIQISIQRHAAKSLMGEMGYMSAGQ